MLEPGLYETIINERIAKELEQLPAQQFQTGALDANEAPDILSRYIALLTKQALSQVRDQTKSEHKLDAQIELVNRIVQSLLENLAQDQTNILPNTISKPGRELLSLKPVSDTRLPETSFSLERPESPLSTSSLFTGSRQDPSLEEEFRSEIQSSDRIDMLVSFVKWSGLRLIYEELKAFCERGGTLRVITTSYMGATDLKAVKALSALVGSEIKISYDTKRTRLHAKTYVFYRNTGYSVAYVGSSNLSGAAISSGLEWNVKVAAKELPQTMQKIEATFDNYWHSDEFVHYDASQAAILATALRAERMQGISQEPTTLFDIHPYPYQKEILERLQAEREVHGRYRNLIVAATGTGKTVLAAFDYLRFKRNRPNKTSRLLFIAHREEILRQSLVTFRQVLRDLNFADLSVGGETPEQIDHLFMSIQTFNSKSWHEVTDANYYDYIVVDEFHHAAAKSYQTLLNYYEPKVLLGLTATPERLDGADVTTYFGGRIAAEIRLPEAIERRLLSPFQYFGVTDDVDLSSLKWARGGYDTGELTKLYTMDHVVAKSRAINVISAVHRYVTTIDDVVGLGFCVSVEHAYFMAHMFNEHQIPSIALTASSDKEERRRAKDRLTKGELRFIFTVDLYNEGVDIPEVNTVLFLRPTESLTVFLQQLGRGLRLAEGKECLTVLDFIAQAHKRYNYQDKFAALLANTKHSLNKEISKSFPSVPKGCHIRLEKVAQEYVLDNIKQSLGSRAGLIERLRYFEEDTDLELTLANFLEYYHLSPRDIYRFSTFSRLLVYADIIEDFTEEDELLLSRAFKRLAQIDSASWLEFLILSLDDIDKMNFKSYSEEELLQLRMLYHTIWTSKKDPSDEDLILSLQSLKENPILLDEMIELFYYLYEAIDFVESTVSLNASNPLHLHSSYSRNQVLAAFGHQNPSTVREGIYFVKDQGIDILFVTLNKSDKDYSPTTLYDDYSINEYLFHWQSQSTTSDTSPTGKRYIKHKEMGSQIVLFVRDSKQDRFRDAMPYQYLGKVDYVKHEGSMPMSITFKLHEPIPAKSLKVTDKVQAG